MKQYFDCVFTHGFAYGTGGDKMAGKHFVASFTVGAPEADYRADGEAHFRVLEPCKNPEQTAYFTRMSHIDPFYFHGTSPVLYTQEQIRARAQKCAAGLVALLEKLDEQGGQ